MNGPGKRTNPSRTPEKGKNKIEALVEGVLAILPAVITGSCALLAAVIGLLPYWDKVVEHVHGWFVPKTQVVMNSKTSASATDVPTPAPTANKTTAPSNTPSNTSAIEVGAHLTAKLDSIKPILNDCISIFATLHNSGPTELAVYIGNPSHVAGTKGQGLALSVIDDSGMTYEAYDMGGITRTPGQEEAGSYGIYLGPNWYVRVPPSSDKDVEFRFQPFRSPPKKVSSIDFFAELRVLEDPQSKQYYDTTWKLQDVKVHN